MVKKLNKVKNMDKNTNLLKENQDKIVLNVHEHTGKIENLKEKNKKLEAALSKCQRNLNYLSFKERAKNIIIFNISDTPDVNHELYFDI